METYESAALDALGDPTRRAIFERLGRGPSAVGELARDLPVSRPAVSQHLKVLKEAGLVVDQAVGTRRVYRLNPPGVAGMQAYFQRFWAHALTSFKAAAEHQHSDQHDDQHDQHSDQHDDRPTHGTTQEETRT